MKVSRDIWKMEVETVQLFFGSCGSISSGGRTPRFSRCLQAHFDTRWHSIQTSLQATAFLPSPALQAVLANYFFVLPSSPLSRISYLSTPLQFKLVLYSRNSYIKHIHSLCNAWWWLCFPDQIKTNHPTLHEDKTLNEDHSNIFKVLTAPCPYTVHIVWAMDKNG